MHSEHRTGDANTDQPPRLRSAGAATLGVAAGLALLAAGCGDNSREDVRVSFCKQLVLTQVAVPATVRWTRVATDPRRYAGLVVSLGFDEDGRSRQATCEYRYDAVEDTAQHLADPLSAYATSPRTMTIDGQALSRQALATAIGQAMLREGRDLIERARQGL